ncbi:hypothetical protein, partial [Mycoplasma sp. HS2188]|uniref:hypothetical protein n=1 Tax=Mycoplasma sp. HS2188 TaxID=2976765 RepID=UPI0021AAD7CD
MGGVESQLVSDLEYENIKNKIEYLKLAKKTFVYLWLWLLALFGLFTTLLVFLIKKSFNQRILDYETYMLIGGGFLIVFIIFAILFLIDILVISGKQNKVILEMSGNNKYKLKQ